MRLLGGSIVVDVLDVLAGLVLLLELLLKVEHLLAEQIVHPQLLLYDCFQPLDVGVHVVVHKSDALDGRDQLALLS